MFFMYFKYEDPIENLFVSFIFDEGHRKCMTHRNFELKIKHHIISHHLLNTKKRK